LIVIPSKVQKPFSAGSCPISGFRVVLVELSRITVPGPETDCTTVGAAAVPCGRLNVGVE
jgi:hypothetical protein